MGIVALNTCAGMLAARFFFISFVINFENSTRILKNTAISARMNLKIRIKSICVFLAYREKWYQDLCYAWFMRRKTETFVGLWAIL